jgi:hypothetical protein
MANLNDIIKLAKADGGKFFVMDEQGEAKLVIMNVDDYEKLLLGKIQRQIVDVEKINKEILQAQLLADQEFAVPQPIIHPVEKGPTLTSQPEESNGISSYLRKPGTNDLREEVIDPSFDFEGPKVEIDDL